jgi:hypothetical protein
MKREPDQADVEKRARAYIDKVAAINRRHGMGDQIPQDRYEQAVAETTRAFRNLRTARRAG